MKNLITQRYYHNHAKIQEHSAGIVLQKLKSLCEKKISSIADLGCGTGFLTIGCGDMFPNATIDAIDIVKDSLLFLQNQWCNKNARLNTICQPAETHLKRCKVYDLVVSNFAMHWMEEGSLILILREIDFKSKYFAVAFPVCGSLESLAARSEQFNLMNLVIKFPSLDNILIGLGDLSFNCEIVNLVQDFSSIRSAINHIKKTGMTVEKVLHGSGYSAAKLLANSDDGDKVSGVKYDCNFRKLLLIPEPFQLYYKVAIIHNI